jgi:hypothetical protein
MARLNKKSTKAAIVKLLKHNADQINTPIKIFSAEDYLLELAKDLELGIKPEDYK